MPHNISQWLRVRHSAIILPVIAILLVLDFALAGKSMEVTRILGVGANLVDVNQAAVAPLATMLYIFIAYNNPHRERSSDGRAQKMSLATWLIGSTAAGAVPLILGYAMDVPSLRVSGVAFLGLLGLAGIFGYLVAPPLGSAMPLTYLAMSFILTLQLGGAYDLLWPLATDARWQFAWTAPAIWILGTIAIGRRPPARHCR